ncbi:MAG: biotin--[acetyl-CoA-carboxylase] ligase [Rhodocyclaceae bacterium]|nr:biotin--[acetyl-CoA-carboxylase] ligase [Rhodocyclaceae bacterium]
MTDLPAPLDLPRLKSLLGDVAPRLDVDALPVCDSTSSVLMARAEAGAPSGSVLVCERQTAGRGRRGRSWIAPAGGSLAFSLLWRFAPGSKPPMGLSLAVGVAVARALEKLGVTGAALKWPNDVLIGGRKLAGILVELAPLRNRSMAVVIGIGINLLLPEGFPDGPDMRACDLASVLSATPSRPEVLAALLRELVRALDAFQSGGFAALRGDWLARHAHQDRAVRLLDEHAPALEGVCRGVDEDGALLLETEAGVCRILAGEVSLRPSESARDADDPA